VVSTSIDVTARSARLEVARRCARSSRRELAVHRGRGNPAPQLLGDVLGVLHAGAEEEPLLAIGEELTHLVDGRVVSSTSTACSSAPATNSPPRVATPAVSSCVSVAFEISHRDSRP
jgi:hypothetical protein